MPTPPQLNLLISLARNRRDEAGRRLAALNGQALTVQQTLHVLQSYRDDYVRRFEDALKSGAQVTALQNFRDFLSTLDEAIRQQAMRVDESRRALTAGTQAWCIEQKRLKSFDALAERGWIVARTREARREQKHQDEIALRRTLHSS
jgi:flagellar FliJ protein